MVGRGIGLGEVDYAYHVEARVPGKACRFNAITPCMSAEELIASLGRQGTEKVRMSRQ